MPDMSWIYNFSVGITAACSYLSFLYFPQNESCFMLKISGSPQSVTAHPISALIMFSWFCLHSSPLHLVRFMLLNWSLSAFLFCPPLFFLSQDLLEVLGFVKQSSKFWSSNHDAFTCWVSSNSFWMTNLNIFTYFIC